MEAASSDSFLDIFCKILRGKSEFSNLKLINICGLVSVQVVEAGVVAIQGY